MLSVIPVQSAFVTIGILSGALLVLYCFCQMLWTEEPCFGFVEAFSVLRSQFDLRVQIASSIAEVISVSGTARFWFRVWMSHHQQPFV